MICIMIFVKMFTIEMKLNIIGALVNVGDLGYDDELNRLVIPIVTNLRL